MDGYGGKLGRLGLASGAAWVLLILVGNSITESGAPTEDTPAAATAYFALQQTGSHRLAIALELLGFCLMVVFVVRLHAALRETDRGWLPGLALAGGLITVAIKLGSGAFGFVGYAVDDLPADQALLLIRLGDAAFLLSAMTTGLFLLGVAGSALGSGLLPRWFAGIGLVCGAVAVLGSVVPPTSLDGGPGVLGFLLGLLWLGGTSVWLAVRRRPAAAVTGHEAALAPA